MHDLKNPLAAVLMNLEFLASHPLVVRAPALTTVVDESHGGDAEVHAPAEGGTLFRLVLPSLPPLAREAADR